ncbi:MAG: hypothetical protein QGG40_22055, partial [Myxococcota bacterium]|nr:hypothetical protein [Myxococcota bacterium]
PPIRSWSVSPSWRVVAGTDRVEEDGCTGPQCAYYRGAMGIGGTLGIAGNGRTAIYSLLDGEIGLGGSFPRFYRVTLGPTLGLMVQPLPGWRIHAEGTAPMPFTGSLDLGTEDLIPRATVTSAVRLTTDLQVRAWSEVGRGYYHVGGALVWFFMI